MDKFIQFIDKEGTLVLAKALGVSRQTIYNWRSGAHKPTIQRAKKLVEISDGELQLPDIRPDVWEREE